MNQEELLAARYGRQPRNKRRDRLAIIAIAIVGLVGFLVWSISVTAVNSGRPIGKLISFSVESPNLVQVELTAENAQGRDLICQVEVLSNDYEVVGYKEISLADGQKSVKSAVTTVKPAVSAVVKDCWVK
jgi:hypothetical protein